MTASKREKELARQRAERQAARKAAAAVRRRQRTAVLATVTAVLLVAVGLGVLAGTLSDGSDTTDTATAAPRAGECSYDAAGEAARPVEMPPTEGVETSGVYTATMATSRGEIVFEMDSAEAPCAVNNLRSLAHFRFFDDTPCHRLTTQSIFVLQCGDPTGTGTGGPGYRFEGENLQGATYPRGTVAMANSGPGTNGSQFFLVYKDSELPPQYTPFGRITQGLEVLDEVAAAGTTTPDGDGEPKKPVQVTTLRTSAKA